MLTITTIISICVILLIANGAYHSLVQQSPKVTKIKPSSSHEQMKRLYGVALVTSISIDPSDFELEEFEPVKKKSLLTSLCSYECSIIPELYILGLTLKVILIVLLSEG